MTRMRTGCCHSGQDDALVISVKLRLRLIELDIGELKSCKVKRASVVCSHSSKLSRYTGLSLAESNHVTWILASDWLLSL